MSGSVSGGQGGPQAQPQPQPQPAPATTPVPPPGPVASALEDYAVRLEKYFPRVRSDPKAALTDAESAQLEAGLSNVRDADRDVIRALAGGRGLQVGLAAGACLAALEPANGAADATSAKCREALLRDIRGGPLSLPSPGAAVDKAAAAILAHYKDHPEVASEALNQAQRVAHPGVLADGVAVLGPLVAGGFAVKDGKSVPSEKVSKMTRHALKMGGALGGTFFTDLDKYWNADKRQDQPNPFDSEADPTKRGAMYAERLGRLIIDANGKLAIGDDFRKICDDMKFSPRSLDTPIAALVDSVEDMTKLLADARQKASLQRGLDGVDGPPHPSVRGFVPSPSGEPSAAEGKAAVMSALIMPFDQGSVGSCFATAPLRDAWMNHKPRVAEYLADIVKTGKLTMNLDGDLTVPAVKRLPAVGNKLQRCLEYTVTTLGSRTEGSREKNKLNQSLFGENPKLGAKDRGNTLAALQPTEEEAGKIREGLSAAFGFEYDPTVAAEPSEDGSSNAGMWRMVDLAGARDALTPPEKIETPEKFVELMSHVLAKALCRYDQGYFVDDDDNQQRWQQIQGLLYAPAQTDNTNWGPNQAFLDAISKGYGTGKSPWEPSSGGYAQDSAGLLTGRKPPINGFFDPKAKGASSEDPPLEVRTKAILEKLVNEVVPSSTAEHGYALIAVEGLHGMNALPREMKQLKPPGAIDRELVEPGRRIADTQLEPDRVDYLHDMLMDTFIRSLPDKKQALTDARDKKPSRRMKPAELRGEMEKKFCTVTDETLYKDLPETARTPDAIVDADKAVEIFTALVGKQTDANKLRDWIGKARAKFRDGTKLADIKKLAKSLTSEDEIFAKVFNSVMLRELDSPQVVIADTNWGSPADHTFFVIAPAPDTGKLTMWKKDAFNGVCTPVDEKWLTTGWAHLPKAGGAAPPPTSTST